MLVFVFIKSNDKETIVNFYNHLGIYIAVYKTNLHKRRLVEFVIFSYKFALLKYWFSEVVHKMF